MQARLPIIIIAVLTVVFPFSIFSVHGLGGPLLTAVKGTNTVSVDGTLGATEWADAQHVKFNWAYNNGTFSNTADLWLKNNGTNLEFAFAVNGTATLNNGNDYYENYIQLLFDHNNNGVVDNYDSLKMYMVEYISGGYASQYLDRHYNMSYNYYDWDTLQDGTAKMVHNNPGGFGRFSAEFSMPLTSTDGPQDFTLPVNGTIGFEVLFQ